MCDHRVQKLQEKLVSTSNSNVDRAQCDEDQEVLFWARDFTFLGSVGSHTD